MSIEHRIRKLEQAKTDTPPTPTDRGQRAYDMVRRVVLRDVPEDRWTAEDRAWAAAYDARPQEEHEAPVHADDIIRALIHRDAVAAGHDPVTTG